MRFRKTYIEITNSCGLSCDFCRKTSRPPRRMDRELFTAILPHLRGRSKLLHFHVMGEPLSHPDVGLFLDICADYGLDVNLVTSGLSLAEKADLILGKTALKQVSVSLHSFAGNEKRLPIEDYLDSVLAFAEKARSPGLKVSLRLWDRNSGADPLLQSRLLSHIARRLSLPHPLELLPTDKNSVKLAAHLYLNPAPRFEWPDLANKDYGRTGTCHGLRDQFAILVDGTVVPCCLDNDGAMALGNVTEQPLEEILSSDRARRICEGFAKGVVVEELCRKCSYRLRFDKKNNAELARNPICSRTFPRQASD